MNVELQHVKSKRFDPVRYTILAFFAGFACGYWWGIM